MLALALINAGLIIAAFPVSGLQLQRRYSVSQILSPRGRHQSRADVPEASGRCLHPQDVRPEGLQTDAAALQQEVEQRVAKFSRYRLRSGRYTTSACLGSRRRRDRRD